MICEALERRMDAPPGPGDDYWYGPYVKQGSLEATPDTAITNAAVFACVRVLAETMAQLPCHVMRDDGTRRTKATDLSLYRVLHTKAWERQTSFEWRETMQTHLSLRGNAYSLNVLDGSGNTVQLVPLNPDRMKLVRLDGASGPGQFRYGYLYQDLDGRQYRLTQGELLHLRGLSLDGVCGVSPITACRRAIELSMQAEHHGLMWWKNASKPGGVLKHPTELDDQAYQRLKKSWREAHTAQDLYTVAILEGGTEFDPIGISNQDSEWLDSRRFQITEICRIFRVPPHMIASAIEHGNTYANVEQSDLNFTKHTMLPWIVRWEQSLGATLIDDPELYVHFVIEGLLRADLKTRAEFYKEMFGMAAFTTNIIMEKEDMDPIGPEGDRRFVSTKYIPIELAGKQQQPARPAAEKEEKLLPLIEGVTVHSHLDAWILDAADRLANAECRLYETETTRHPEQDAYTCVMASYDGRHRQYALKAIQPIAFAVGSEASLPAIVGTMADTMAAMLQSSTPENVLHLLKSTRQDQLAAIIREGMK